MSSALYSVGSASGAALTSSTITLTTAATQETLTIEEVIVAANGSAGTVTATLSIGGVVQGEPIVTAITQANAVYSVPFTSGGNDAGTLTAAAGQAVSLTLAPAGGAQLLVANAAAASLAAGFSATPQVAATPGLLLTPYVRLNKENRRAGAWASSAAPLWPVALITRVRAEADTPTFFSALPNVASPWTFPTTFRSADLGGVAANGCFYFPPLRMPSTLTAADGVVVEVRVGGTTMSTTINTGNLWYTADSTAVQPRVSLAVDAAGTGASIATELFQVYQDTEAFPLQSILSPTPTSAATIATDSNVNFVMYMANGAANAWSYDPYFGNAVQHNPRVAGGNLLRLYDNTEQGRWGWNFGPANVYPQVQAAAATLMSGAKAEGGLGWPPTLSTLINLSAIVPTTGASSAVMAIGAPLSQAHKAYHCVAWGTGILGTGYDPNATVLPYAPRAGNSVTAFNAAGTGWTATNATLTEPMFAQGNYNAQTTGNAVLLVPHYIDREAVYAAISDADANYVKWTGAQVLAGAASVTNSAINVIPANYIDGNVANAGQGILWSSRVRALIADPNVETVATSSLHILESALSHAKKAVVMKFGDLVLGQGGKFKDFLETYTSQANFSYTEPNTYVIPPAALDGLTIANFNSHQSYTARFPSGDAVRGAYGVPYQGFPGYCRYLLAADVP